MSNFLYDNPRLYEKIFRSASDVCARLFRKHLPKTASSMLDIGCGSGRELSRLSQRYPDCVGIDTHPTMLAFAQQKNPDLTLLKEDMRSCRLNRTFDAIYSVGDTINYAISNDALCETIKTYQAHAHKGTVLLLEPLNPYHFFGKLQLPGVFYVTYKNSIAMGEASYKLLARQQLVERIRTWKIGKRDEIVESLKLRVIFPAELTYFLKQYGFEVIEILEKSRNAMYVNSVYIVAIYTGDETNKNNT